MTTVGKLRVDMADLTLGELADVADVLGAPLAEALQGQSQPRAIAAIVCVLQRRTDPAYTYEQALGLRMAELEIVAAEATGPEVPAGNNGAAPVLLPASGG